MFYGVFQPAPSTVRQMLSLATDELPDRWRQAWRKMDDSKPYAYPDDPFQTLLDLAYYSRGRECAEIDGKKLRQIGDIISRMLYFESSSRATAEEILCDPWFQNECGDDQELY